MGAMSSVDPSRCPKCGVDGSSWDEAEAAEHLATCEGPAGGFSERRWARDMLSMPKTQLSPTVKGIALTFMLSVEYRTLSGYAGVEALSRQTGYDRKTVSRALVRLRALGWLKRTKVHEWKGGKAAVHQLTWPSWWQFDDAKRTTGQGPGL